MPAGDSYRYLSPSVSALVTVTIRPTATPPRGGDEVEDGADIAGLVGPEEGQAPAPSLRGAKRRSNPASASEHRLRWIAALRSQ